MFSELCRETLRKAAVCYSSARAGSPSPSPPTSPPPSPAKEAKTAANADLANVRDAGHEGTRDHQHHPGTTGRRASPSGNATGESRDPAAERSTTDRSNDVREYVYVRCEADIGSLLCEYPAGIGPSIDHLFFSGARAVLSWTVLSIFRSEKVTVPDLFIGCHSMRPVEIRLV